MGTDCADVRSGHAVRAKKSGRPGQVRSGQVTSGQDPWKERSERVDMTSNEKIKGFLVRTLRSLQIHERSNKGKSRAGTKESEKKSNNNKGMCMHDARVELASRFF